MALAFTAKDVRGIFNIIPTPATADAARWDCEDSVDYEETERLVSMLLEIMSMPYLTNGTFGECATLTEPEWRKFMQK